MSTVATRKGVLCAASAALKFTCPLIRSLLGLNMTYKPSPVAAISLAFVMVKQGYFVLKFWEYMDLATYLYKVDLYST